MEAIERFLEYVAVDTQSCEHAQTSPSTPGQRDFVGLVADELVKIGLSDIEIDPNGYLMATLPATGEKEDTPVIGFIAHVDTSPDFSGKDVKPRIVTCTGSELMLNEEKQITLSPRSFPELNDYVGQELVVTDGTTLLGADNKAGVAAIVSAAEYLMEHTEIPHGKVRIAFTPDEEIGRSADLFDVAKFGCQWAYTVDGGELGALEYENFNAARADIVVHGCSIHPGYAKGKMVNAALLAMELNASLPAGQRPEQTAGNEGFFHLIQISGNVEKATLSYLIREHDRVLFDEKKWVMQWAVKQLNRKYPDCLEMKLYDQYHNMREILDKNKEIITLAAEAMLAVGVNPVSKPIRGGTDGARLSFAGLPCPNIFTGGMNGHSPYEFLPVASFRKSIETIVQIIRSV
jgi:tripeptide aminopeptidase